MEPREEQSSLPLQTCTGKEPERARARVVPWWGKSSRQEPRQNGPEEPWQGAVLNATEDKKQPAGATLGAHPGSLESFLPPHVGHEGHLGGARAAGT